MATIATALLLAVPIQVGFNPHPILDSVEDPAHVFVADLDGDGDDDLVSFSSLDGEIRIVEQTGPLSTRVSLGAVPSVPGVLHGAAGDLDGDGDADLLAVTSTEVVALFQGAGIEGVWTTLSLPLSGISPPFDTHAHDFDGDGADEIVFRFGDEVGIVDAGSGLAYAWLQQGPSRFLSLVDVNSDGLMDVVTVASGPTTGWHESDGAGAFTRRSMNHGFTAGCPMDVDGDGITDMLVGERVGPVTFAPWRVEGYTAQGLGGGAFGPLVPLSQPILQEVCFITFTDPIDMTIGRRGSSGGDLFGDGLADPMVSYLCPASLPQVPILKSTGPGAWLELNTAFGSTPIFGRIDGDGDFDQIVANENLRVFPTASAFDGAEPVVYAGSWAGGARVSVADLNADGQPDIVDVAGLIGGSTTAMGAANGAFPRRHRQPFAREERGILEDLDGDGHIDLLQGSRGREFTWCRGSGDGGFGAPVLVGMGPGVTASDSRDALRAGDLDGDGDVDVINVASSSGHVDAWFNVGAGVFSPRVPLGVTGGDTLELVDLDVDGDLDLLLPSAGSLRVLEGQGDGTFLGPFDFPLGAPALDIATSDLDGDGDLDVAVVYQGAIGWIENVSGPGGLVPHVPDALAAGYTGLKIQLADRELDGTPDALISARFPDNGWGLIWLPLMGGSFQADQEIRIGGRPDFEIADLDEDGDPDVIVGFGTELDWYENLADPIDFVGERFCTPAIGNSTGVPARLRAIGSPDVLANDLTLTADRLPLGSFGYFLASLDPGDVFPVNDSQGRLCLGGSIGRYVGPGQIQSSGSIGLIRLTLDLGAVPQPTGSVSAQSGEAWHFQGWFRDANPTVTSNFTDGLRVVLR